MAITDITLGVPDLGNTASVTVGANSPAPYAGAQVTGLTDGTSPNNASRNKAEVYNRLLFAYRHAVEQAGLVFDKDNWAQMSQAISAIAAGAAPVASDTVQGKVALNLGTALPADASNATDALTAAGLNAMLTAIPSNAVQAAVKAASALNPAQYGTLAGVGAPTAAPTAANPATELTNANGEVFRWNGTSWYLSGNGYTQTISPSTNVVLPTSVLTNVLSVVAPRAGVIALNASLIYDDTSGGSWTLSRTTLLKNAALLQFVGWTRDTSASGAAHNVAKDVSVAAGDVIVLAALCNGATAKASSLSFLQAVYTN